MNEVIDQIRKEIGDDLRRRRRYKNMSILGLSKKAGIDEETLAAIEGGKRNCFIDTLISVLCAVDDGKGYGTNIIYKSVNKYSTKMRCHVIQRIVSEQLGLNPVVVNGRFRDIDLLKARYYGYKLMKGLTKASVSDIGRMYNRTHATVLNGLEEISNWEETRNKLYKDYPKIRKVIVKRLGLKK